jgi:hypothetical protein
LPLVALQAEQDRRLVGKILVERADADAGALRDSRGGESLRATGVRVRPGGLALVQLATHEAVTNCREPSVRGAAELKIAPPTPGFLVLIPARKPNRGIQIGRVLW